MTTAPLTVVAVAGLSRGWLRLVSGVAIVMLWSGGMLIAQSEPAAAHDPGQGELLDSVEFTVSSDGNGAVTVQVLAREHCEDLTARHVVVRRAGESLSTPLTKVGPCSFGGAARVDQGGRWFVYAEFSHEDTPAEAWLPVDTSALSSTTQTRPLYSPSGSAGRVSAAQVAWGALLYLLGSAVLGVGVTGRATARRQRDRSALTVYVLVVRPTGAGGRQSGDQPVGQRHAFRITSDPLRHESGPSAYDAVFNALARAKKSPR